MIGPDEACYATQAAAIRERGWRGFRVLADRFTEGSASLPSPVRWLWLALCAVFGIRAVVVVSALLTPIACAWLFSFWLPGWSPVIVACGSPLLWTLARRRLQDVTVSLLTIVALGCASLGSPWLLCLALLALLGTKEAAVLMVPAIAGLWLTAGHPVLPLALALGASLALWLDISRALLGPNLWRVLRAARAGHGTAYTLAHQRGDWHRLCVDLVLVSPWPCALFALGMVAAPKLAIATALVVTVHAVAPVRNARTVLAADLLIRGLAGATLYAFSPWLLLPMFAADVLGAWRLRGTYDPVTATLTAAFGMTPRQ